MIVTEDPFTWDENDEDEVRTRCRCGWTGEWRELFRQVRDDERSHTCAISASWRAAA